MIHRENRCENRASEKGPRGEREPPGPYMVHATSAPLYGWCCYGGVSATTSKHPSFSHSLYTDAFLLFAVPVSHCRKRTGKFSFEPVCLLVYGSCFYSVCIRLILLILRKKVRHKGGHQKNSLEKFLVKNVHFYFGLIASKDPKGEHQRSPYVLACLEIKSDVTFGLYTNPTFTLS